MQVHLDTPHPGPGDIHAICNPGGQFGSFAVVKVGPVEFYLHDDADCDALIIAVTDAKRMLQAAVSGECHPFGGGPGVRRGWCARCGLLPGEAIHYIPGCPSVSPDGDACTEAGAHQFHRGPDDDGMHRMWTDADALAASIASGQPVTVAGDAPPCGLRLWGDTSLCELPAGHDPLPSCLGKPRPFARTTAAPAAPSAAEVANAFNAQYGVPAPFPPATDPAEAADPGYLEDAAAQDDDEAGDPFLGHAPSGMQGPAPVARVLDDGERPATWMACGDSLEDDQPHEPGSPAECPRHGQTYFISEAQWLARVPPEHGGELPRRVVSLDSRMGFVSRLDGAKVRTGGEL